MRTVLLIALSGCSLVATEAIGMAGVFGASSAYGAVQVHRCRVEHAKRPGWSLEDAPAVM